MDQAINERTLSDAIDHLNYAIEELDIIFLAIEAAKMNGIDNLIINGPILSPLSDIHDRIIKAYNTVQYVKELTGN